jgi:hypothetical protein
MAFRFSLAAVLRIRESVKNREELALQRIQMEMAQVVRRIEETDRAMTKAHATRELMLRQAMPAGHLHSMLLELQSAAAGKAALRQQLQGLEEQRLKQMKIYQAAHRAHETIINIFNEQREAYEIHQARVEQKYLDDIFMARRHRA